MEEKRSSFWKEFTPILYSLIRGEYSWKWFKCDFIAGCTVGIVALTLSMAFAIASGVSPEKGIYTSIVAGFLIALLGGSRFQIGGPTAAFVTILYTIVQKDGYEGLIFSTLLAGAILLIAAFSRIGSLIKYIPYPLIIGFTSGIAVIIFSSQVKDFLGLQISNLPADFFPKWKALLTALPSWDLTTFLVSIGTLLFILFIRKFFPLIPWMIPSVVLMTAISYGFHFQIATISSHFGEISNSLPSFSLPSLSFFHWNAFIRDGFTIAFLAGIESLLTALVADGMSATRHKSNCELMAQGVANIACGLFGGISASGVIPATAINIKSGAKTPIASMIHSLTLVLIILFLSPIVSQIPLCVLSAILIIVAWDMSQLHLFRELFKAPKGDIAILLTSFSLTVLVDLTVAVEIGMTLAAFLLIKRLGDQCKVDISPKEEPSEKNLIFPKEIAVYSIFGPFFFGVSDRLQSILSHLESKPQVFILQMDKVPFIDASGMQALKDFFIDCEKHKIKLYLSGVEKSLMDSLEKFEVIQLIGNDSIFSDFKESFKQAQTLVFKR